MFKLVYIDDVRHQGLDWKMACARVSKDKEIEDDTKVTTNSYLLALLDATIGRRFCVTTKGRFALVPARVVQGDFVCLVPRTLVPLILRQVESNDNKGRDLVLGR